MTQPFADALTWMPKSRALGATLTRAHDMARAQGHQNVLLEHVLQSLIEDPDASAVLLACNIDLLSLNDAVSQHLSKQPVAGSSQPQASPGLLVILEYAAAAARQSKRSEVNGAIVLAAMAGEGKSDAARMLKAAGLKFEDTIQALKKAPPPRVSDGGAGAGAVAPRAVVPAPAVAPPPLPAQAHFQTGEAITASAAAEPLPSLDSVAGMAANASTNGLEVGLSSLTRSQQQLPNLSAAPSAQPVSVNADEDPLTTARRRVAALRSGNGAGGSPPLSAAAIATAVPEPPALAVGMGTAGFAPSASSSGALSESSQATTWAPPPQPVHQGSNVRPMRMPPPLPQVPLRPPPIARPGQPDPRAAVPLRAPWSGPGGDASEVANEVSGSLLQQSGAQVITGQPIDPTRLGDGFPYKMLERTGSTIEIRIPRSAIFATAAAMRVGVRDNRDTALMRAVSVRLKSPNGGVFVESASPETQWFEGRSAQRDDDEVRWRWVVTPQSSGTKALQIALSMRTVAQDGTVIDTALPEHLVSIRVGSNYREAMRRLGRAFIALSAGVAVTLIATGGFASMFGKLFR